MTLYQFTFMLNLEKKNASKSKESPNEVVKRLPAAV